MKIHSDQASQHYVIQHKYTVSCQPKSGYSPFPECAEILQHLGYTE